MQAVIMAGGKGTRLSALTKDLIPKAMVEVKGIPLIGWQIKELKKYNINKITVVVGHLKDKIIEYLKDGKEFDCEIDYIIENEALGTAGAFYYLKDRIKDEYFLLVFGDVFFNIDIDRMEAFHKEKKSLATLFIHPNSHPFDSDLVEIDINNKIINFDSKNNTRNYYYNNLVNAGIYILNKSVLDKVSTLKKIDLEKDILSLMIKNNENIYGYVSSEYVKDVGTPERIESMLIDLEKKVIENKNLKKKQKAIFLDRDGTINKLNSFIYKENQFELEDFVVEAIKLINKSSYLAIVLTNQPSVARGLCEEEDIEYIHKKLKTLLGEKGAYLDGIYFCPHHPDKGFLGENIKYKISCNCRKPQLGLLEKAEKDFNIDISSSYMIGDSTIDLEFAKRAKLKSILLETGYAGKDGKYEAKEDFKASNLLEAVKIILNKEEKNDRI